MADEQTASTELYVMNTAEIQNVNAPDDLVSGTRVTAGKIKITTPGSYYRGELLMSTGDNEFIPATKTGLASAKEICILCQSLELDEGAYTETAGYFIGDFNGESVILPYEDVNSIHSEELDAIMPILRLRGIFIE